MKKGYLILLFTLFTGLTSRTLGQITPPGLDGAKTVGWVAVGFTQSFSPRLNVTMYAGKSDQSLADAAFWKKPAIIAINQEWAYLFSPHWQVAMAGSLRTQSLFDETPPYEPHQPPVRTEFRLYSRLYYRHHQGPKLSWAHSFRPEYRRFYTADWHSWSNPLQIRLRWKSQLTYPLNSSHMTQLIGANEVLTTVDRIGAVDTQPAHWGPYKFSEDRLSTFIRRGLKKPAINIDMGLMHQFWWDVESQKIRYTLYFSVDFLLRNPIKKWASM